MNLVRLAVTAAAAVVVVACSSSSDSSSSQGTAHCATAPGQCRCKSDAFNLFSDESAAASCDSAAAPAGETWDTLACCYDVDSDGFTTSCDCLAWSCYHSDKNDECTCGWYGDDTSRGTLVSGCSQNSHDSLCCQEPSVDADTNACSCNGAFTSCSTRPGYESSSTVTSCGVVPRSCIGKSATSCDGLKWKPASSSSGGGSGSGSKECTSDSACSSKCSSGCYQCLSGSCSCGYQGSDGCVF